MAAKMLNHVNLQYHGTMISKALQKVLKSGKVGFIYMPMPNLKSFNTISNFDLFRF